MQFHKSMPRVRSTRSVRRAGGFVHTRHSETIQRVDPAKTTAGSDSPLQALRPARRGKLYPGLYMRLVALAAIAASAFAQPADLVLRNGKIVTVSASMPMAQALAVRAGKITALGSDSQAQQWIGPRTRVIDLHGMLAIPGFIEGHGHFTSVGEFRLGLDLREARTWDQIVEQVARAAKAGQAGRLDRGPRLAPIQVGPSARAQRGRLPAARFARQGVARNPVLLEHASGHAAFVNAKALQAAGITRDTPNPSGGEILKDQQGNPTGLMRERAADLVSGVYGKWQASHTDLRREIALASDEAVAKGITTFEDAGSPFATVDVLLGMAEKGELKLRLWVMLRAPNGQLAPNLDRYRTIGAGDNHLTVRAIKRQMDGALGSRGAWLLEPYTDKPDSSGLNTEDPADIRKTAELAIAHGYQLCVHAIGDRANREVLDIYEQTFRGHPDLKDLRWRIEHAQHLNAADIPRFGQLRVIAAMQAIHCTSDAPYVILRLGPKRAEEGAYVWQKLMKSGGVVGNGTDAPVEDVSPIACFYAAVTRKLKDGSVFYPGQRMSREEALRSYTWNNAYAAFEETLKGSLEARQAGRHHSSLARHHDDSGRRDSFDRRGVYDRGREGDFREPAGARR